MASLVKQSSTQLALKFFLTATSDHITGLTGATPTVTIRKEGGSFASPAGAVTEIANGWYQVAGNATDTNTLGDILLHATAGSADPCDMIAATVVAFDPQAALATPTNITAGTITTVSGNVTGSVGSVTGAVGSVTGNVGGSVASVTAAITLPSIPANWLTATGIAASALNGKGDWNIGKTGYSLTQAFPTNFSALGISVGGHISNVDTLTTYTGDTPQTGDSYARIGAAGAGLTSVALTSAYDYAKGTVAMVESYAASTATMTPAQALYGIHQYLTNFSIAGTSYTVTKRDKTTTAFTVTLNDATSPTGASE